MKITWDIVYKKDSVVIKWQLQKFGEDHGRIENVHMTPLRQHNSTTKFWMAKYCMFSFDVEK